MKLRHIAVRLATITIMVSDQIDNASFLERAALGSRITAIIIINTASRYGIPKTVNCLTSCRKITSTKP